MKIKVLLTAAFVAIALSACSSHSTSSPAARAVKAAQPASPAVSTASAAAQPSHSVDQLELMYATICEMLVDGTSESDVISQVAFTGYTSKQLVQDAEKQNCPQQQQQQQQAPAMTTSQQQAVESAQGYLDNVGGFSKKGLLKQLTSSYGAGFSEKDAEFAISYLKPDWNAQAVEAAKSYLKNVGGFSRASLLQQLTSDYGAGFTEAQAEYAVSKVGL